MGSQDPLGGDQEYPAGAEDHHHQDLARLVSRAHLRQVQLVTAVHPPHTARRRRREVIFIALDKAEDVKKLLSLELTGAFINEAREIPKAVLDAVTMRVGRYPSQRDGGPTWSGVIMDTNAPDEDHWWAIMSGDVPPPEFMSEEEVEQLVKPRDWEFFSQPGAMHAVKEGGRCWVTS